jgi:MFS family permease
VRAKRLLVLAGVVAVALSVLILWLWSSFPLVALAEVLQGITGGVLGPAVVAISLGERTSMCGVVDSCTLCIDMNCSRESCTS